MTDEEIVKELIEQKKENTSIIQNYRFSNWMECSSFTVKVV